LVATVYVEVAQRSLTAVRSLRAAATCVTTGRSPASSARTANRAPASRRRWL